MVVEALGGSREASDRMIERLDCVPRMLHRLNQRYGAFLNRDDLEDATQDVLTTLWEKLPAYRGEAKLESWTFSFCQHQIMNAIRRKERPLLVRTGVPVVGKPTAMPSSVDALERDRVHVCLEALPPEEACVIRAKHFDSLTLDEVAVRLAMPATSVRRLYYTGLERMRLWLERRPAIELA